MTKDPQNMLIFNHARSIEISGRLYEWLRATNPKAFVQGDPRKEHETTIDGDFNLPELVSAMAEWVLEHP